MLKRVKRKTSKQHSTADKTEDVSLKSNKNGVPSEVELLEQLTAELKVELNTLKEQLEREKKNSAEVKSLKTQQICTLTFKLANAVRQRERAEEELAKIQKEMEELKEVIKSQEGKLKGRSLREDMRDAETEKTDESAEHELVDSKETEDVEKSLKLNWEELKGAEVEGLTYYYLARKTEYFTEDTRGVDQQVKENGGIKNVLETQEKEAKVNESRRPDEYRSEHLFPKETPQEKEGESELLRGELEINGSDRMCLKPIKNEGEKLLIENSSPENYSQGETLNGDDLQSEISPILSLTLSGFESWKEKSSFPENSEESFYLEDSKYKSSEICFSSRANSSFETCNKFAKGKDGMVQDSNIPSNHLSLCGSSSTPNVEKSLTKSLTKPDDDEGDEDEGRISESGNPRSARKNRRMRSLNSEDQESSPSTSTDEESVGYLPVSAHSLGHHGMAKDHSAAVRLGNYQRLQIDDLATGDVKKTEKRGVEGFYSKQQSTPKERIFQNTKNVDSPNKSLELGQWKQHTSLSQNVSEDVKELKEKLKSALKEIIELRLENKEMKKEMRKLSTSAEENAFLVKTTQFTDRLLRDMREREAKVHAQRAHVHSTCETYELEEDFSYSRNPEVRSVRWLTSAQRRSDECLNRLTQSKSSLLSLKVLGAKLKDITRSVENMALDPDLDRETLRQPFRAPDVSCYNQSRPNSVPRNDHPRIAEKLIIPERYSERLSAVQSVPIDQETSGETSTVARTAVEKLGEEGNLVPSNTQHLLAEKDSARRDKTFQITDHAPEMKGSEGCTGNWHQDTKDHIQRYIVRSSDCIAKLRDLKPEEMTVDSKFR